MLVESARVKHKHTEWKYATCRAWRYLAGLGPRLWFWDDLQGDNTVGFFLQAQTTVEKPLDLFEFMNMCLEPVSQPTSDDFCRLHFSETNLAVGTYCPLWCHKGMRHLLQASRITSSNKVFVCAAASFLALRFSQQDVKAECGAKQIYIYFFFLRACTGTWVHVHVIMNSQSST